MRLYVCRRFGRLFFFLLQCSPVSTPCFYGNAFLRKRHVEQSCAQRINRSVQWHGFCQTVRQHRGCVYPARKISEMSCFKADKSIAKRLLSTCFVLGDTRCENRLSQSANQTCTIDADAVSPHPLCWSWTRIRRVCTLTAEPYALSNGDSSTSDYAWLSCQHLERHPEPVQMM